MRGRARAQVGSVEKTLARQPWECLAPVLASSGADVKGAMARLRRYASILLEWNRQVSNIMSHNDEQRIVERHLLESLAPAAWLIESGCTHWVDFGSGAGFPAIPLAIAGVGARWTLVESRRTKTLFLRKMLQEISLHGFDVVHDRLENLVLDPAHAGSYEGFTSRATERIAPTLTLAARIVRPGGSAFLWKGSGGERELEADADWKKDWQVTGTKEVGNGPNIVVKFTRNSDG